MLLPKAKTLPHLNRDEVVTIGHLQLELHQLRMVGPEQGRNGAPHTFDVHRSNLFRSFRGVVAHELHQVLVPVK